MSNWNQKFKYDLPSAYASSKEINPAYLHYVLTSKGFACPDLKEGNSLIIGSGKSLPLTLQTACKSSNWQGVEFNPNLVNMAKRRAKQCQINIDLSSDDLSEFAKRDNLPKFDLICLHGVWSWISKEDQELIVDIVAKHLNDGGIFFISYNCTVGMINYESVRDLINLYDKTKNLSSIDDQQRVLNIGQFIFPIAELNPAYVVSQPDFANRIQDATCNPKPFLSDSLNTYWSMDHFSEVAQRLERADVGYVCSAKSADHLDHINLTKEQIEFLEPLIGNNLYEETRDFILNQRFRHDIYIKGALPLSPDEYLSELSSHFVVMLSDLSDFDYKLVGNRGDVELNKAIYEPLINILGDNEPKNIGAVLNAILEQHQDLNIEDLVQALNTLIFSGLCSVTVDPNSISEETKDQCFRLNVNTIKSFDDNEPILLCSPLLQDTVLIDSLDAYMLRMLLENPNSNYLNIVEGLLTLNVQGVISINAKDESVNEDDIIEHASLIAQAFLGNSVPMYSRLMII